LILGPEATVIWEMRKNVDDDDDDRDRECVDVEIKKIDPIDRCKRAAFIVAFASAYGMADGSVPIKLGNETKNEKECNASGKVRR
jgi:hypothetical protein